MPSTKKCRPTPVTILVLQRSARHPNGIVALKALILWDQKPGSHKVKGMDYKEGDGIHTSA